MERYTTLREWCCRREILFWLYRGLQLGRSQGEQRAQQTIDTYGRLRGASLGLLYRPLRFLPVVYRSVTPQRPVPILSGIRHLRASNQHQALSAENKRVDTGLMPTPHHLPYSTGHTLVAVFASCSISPAFS